MQFKYPELLWALFLLLIPILIHLFQLRRFKKTPFTNVKLLQKVVSESRRSNSLKKWLLLATRLLLFASFIIAFAQPFFAKKTALQNTETTIYLDDSFSMQAKTEKGTLLETAIQELIKSVPGDKPFNLFTNTIEFKDVTLKDIQNNLLTLKTFSKQLNLDEINLKATTLFSKDENVVKNLVLISDFQKRMSTAVIDTSNIVQKHLVQLAPNVLDNISLDTLYISSSGTENIELTALLTSNTDRQSTPVSLFNGEKLIAKTSAAFQDNKSEVTFTLSTEDVIKGKLEISDAGLAYDNRLYFNIDEKEKPKVLVIGDASSDFLKRIYSDDEFMFSSFTLKNLNYRDIDTQNLIVLNELENIPNSLIASLSSFVDNGGNLVIIPSIELDLNGYNQLLSRFSIGSYLQEIIAERNITQIAFSHPLFQNVFEKNVKNFQYPKVSKYLKISTTAPSILKFQGGDPFLSGAKGVYLFTASISNQNSNFKQSPLIVPTFYKMGVNSLKSNDLYKTIDGLVEIDIAKTLSKDHILKVLKGEYEFIPQQQSYANKVSLTFNNSPSEDGIYGISENGTALKNISFNYPRDESTLIYLDLNNIKSNSKQTSISTLFQNLQNDNTITELWKWFVILAVLFILIEVLIIKFLK